MIKCIWLVSHNQRTSVSNRVLIVTDEPDHISRRGSMGADNMLGNGVVDISNIISFWSYLISSNAHLNFHYILNRHINFTAYDLVL